MDQGACCEHVRRAVAILLAKITPVYTAHTHSAWGIQQQSGWQRHGHWAMQGWMPSPWAMQAGIEAV